MITMHEAMTANAFEHVSLTNADGSPQRFRRNGCTKRWKRKPEAFRIPVKRGLYEYGYITELEVEQFRAA